MDLSDSAMATAELLYFGDGDYGIYSKFITDSFSSPPSSSYTTTFKRSKTDISKEWEISKGTNKKQKKEASGTIKVRKDKLGDRIATLQRLVSPFGKSDTASVLHEVLGYIQFLHDQVQVLSSPYLLLPANTSSLQDGSWNKDQAKECELRSRGLCLVQISRIEEVISDTNDAHLYSTAIESNLCSKKGIDRSKL